MKEDILFLLKKAGLLTDIPAAEKILNEYFDEKIIVYFSVDNVQDVINRKLESLEGMDDPSDIEEMKKLNEITREEMLSILRDADCYADAAGSSISIDFIENAVENYIK